MFANWKHLQSKEDKCLFYKYALCKEGYYAIEARSVVYTRLYCLKKVYKRVYLKELCLIKYGLYELKAKEAKMDSNLTEE